MRYVFLVFIFGMILVCAFAQKPQSHYINSGGTTLKERIAIPDGYTRVGVKAGSFGDYLRNMKLKPHGSTVHYYDGRVKENNGVYVAVVDMPIGNRDLQQCADVIMHVRAEYLYSHHMEDQIHFTLTNGFKADFSKWAGGYRITIAGNKTQWVKKAVADHSVKSLKEYMDVIYMYCGTLSLSKELKHVGFDQMQPGDILIKGGSPGHAELLLDVAKNKEGKKIYILSQSYMPAQEMQVLANPENSTLSPWYRADAAGANIVSPEWTFTTNQLMRFEGE